MRKGVKEKFVHIDRENLPKEISSFDNTEYYMLSDKSGIEKSEIIHLGKITKIAFTPENRSRMDDGYGIIPSFYLYTFENGHVTSSNDDKLYTRKADENGQPVLLTPEDETLMLELKSGGRRRKTSKQKFKKIVSHKKSTKNPSKKRRVYS